jgi:hypothetical protein
VHLFIAIVDSVVELINVCNIVNISSILAIMQNMEEICLYVDATKFNYVSCCACQERCLLHECQKIQDAYTQDPKTPLFNFGRSRKQCKIQ